MDLSFIIVNYNTYEDLSLCLDSLIKKDIKLKYEVIVVDNNSEDRRIEKICTKYTNVNLLLSENNNGFGNACNKGAKKASGKYFIFINPDTIFINDVFNDFYDFMESNSNVAVCTGILENDKGQFVYSFNKFPGIIWELKEAIGRGSNRTIRRMLDEITEKRIEKPFHTDWVVGAFMFFRADVFRKINGFDEDFFLYYEDVDIQKRVKNLGLDIMVIPKLRIVHNERSSVRSFKGENIYYYHMMRSRMIYFSKHMNYPKRLIIKLMHFTGIANRIFFLPFRFEFKNKKRQKIFQYKMMLKFLFMRKKKLIEKRTSDIIDLFTLNSSNEIIKDKFWL